MICAIMQSAGIDQAPAASRRRTAHASRRVASRHTGSDTAKLDVARPLRDVRCTFSVVTNAAVLLFAWLLCEEVRGSSAARKLRLCPASINLISAGLTAESEDARSCTRSCSCAAALLVMDRVPTRLRSIGSMPYSNVMVLFGEPGSANIDSETRRSMRGPESTRQSLSSESSSSKSPLKTGICAKACFC